MIFVNDYNKIKHAFKILLPYINDWAAPLFYLINQNKKHCSHCVIKMKKNMAS